MVGPESLILVRFQRGAGHDAAVLADVVAAPHAEDTTALELVCPVGVDGQGTDESVAVVGLDGRDVEAPALPGDDGAVVDAPCVPLPEPELVALGHEASRSI